MARLNPTVYTMRPALLSVLLCASTASAAMFPVPWDTPWLSWFWDGPETEPSGTYTGSQTALGDTVQVTLDLGDTLSLRLEGAASVDCENEAYTVHFDVILPTNLGVKGNCIHDALAKFSATFGAAVYHANTDTVGIQIVLGGRIPINIDLAKATQATLRRPPNDLVLDGAEGETLFLQTYDDEPDEAYRDDLLPRDPDDFKELYEDDDHRYKGQGEEDATYDVHVIDDDTLGFHNWAVHNRKTYPDNAEYDAHMATFHANKAKIETHNADPTQTFAMGINQFADLDEQGLRERMFPMHTVHGSLPKYAGPSDQVFNVFSHWAVQHNKTYESAEHMRQRFENWLETHAWIEDHNRCDECVRPMSYSVGHNQWSDLTDEERTALLSRPMSPKADRNYDRSAWMKSVQSVPDSVDWVSSGAVSAVRNQQSCGRCHLFPSLIFVSFAC